MGELLTIGEVARLTTRRATALRYYEEIGLLPGAIRVSGRRHHRPDVIRALAVIETAQHAGLTLDEIKALLQAGPGDHAAIEHLRAIAERKLPALDAPIQRTTIVRAWLEAASRCECPDLDECPLFDTTARLPPT
jgi:MerR family redox-sensitive transcriptional activator SoxR